MLAGYLFSIIPDRQPIFFFLKSIAKAKGPSSRIFLKQTYSPPGMNIEAFNFFQKGRHNRHGKGSYPPGINPGIGL